MEITAVSGNTVAQLDQDELHYMVESGNTVLDLKRLLSARVGCSRFQQKLFSDEIGELEDDMPLTPMPNVQLVILPLCIPDETTQEELLQSCLENRVAHLEQLLRKPHDPNGIRLLAHGKTALFMAAQNGHLEVVRLLIEAGADKAAAHSTGATAVFIAAQNGHLEVVRLLIEAGADKDAVKNNGGTALQIAAHNGHLEVVRFLLEAGADKDAARTDGATALFMAYQNGHVEVVQLLREAGACWRRSNTEQAPMG